MKVDEHSDLVSDETKALEITSVDDGVPEVKNRSEVKEWIKEYIEILG